MAEQLTLTTPETVPSKSTSYYRVSRVVLDWDESRIMILLRGEQNERREVTYEGPDARTMLIALNKANLATKSFNTRVLERVAADGIKPGTVTGSPD